MTSNRGYSALVNLIVHPNQSQPVGRSRRTGISAIKTLERCGYTRRRSLPSTHFNQCSGNRPDHIAKEAVSRDNNRDFVRLLLDIDADQRANMVFSVRARNGERGEIVCADKRGGGALHLLNIKLPAKVMNIAIDERTDNIAYPYAISISLPGSGVASIKRIRDWLNFEDANVAVEIAVDRVAQQAGFEVSLHEEICDLGFRMNARIRASRAVDGHGTMIKNRKRSRDLTLNTAAIRLYLPAVIVRAVILDCDLEVQHE